MNEAETAVGRNPQAGKADAVRSAPITPTEKEPQRKRQRISNDEQQDVNETADAAQEPTESRKMFECIKMITCDGYDISEFCTEQGCKTNFPDSDYYLKFPKKSIANVILKLNDIVIEKIRVEMRNAKKGAIIHELFDNYRTEPNVLYVGVAASYNGVDGKPVQNLLACGYPSKDKDQKDPEEAKAKFEFNACHSMNFIQRDVFSDRFGFNETDLDEWLACTISEEYGVASRLVGKKFDCPKVPCHSGLLDSQIRDMLVRTKETRGGAGRLVSHACEPDKDGIGMQTFQKQLRTFCARDSGDWRQLLA